MISRQTYRGVLDTGISASSIEVSKLGRKSILVELSGEFDARDLDDLRRSLDYVTRSGRLGCVDLSGVTFLDLLCARELAGRSSPRGRLVIRNPSRQARLSLEACVLGARNFWGVVGDGTREELDTIREIRRGARSGRWTEVLTAEPVGVTLITSSDPEVPCSGRQARDNLSDRR